MEEGTQMEVRGAFNEGHGRGECIGGLKGARAQIIEGEGAEYPREGKTKKKPCVEKGDPFPGSSLS